MVNSCCAVGCHNIDSGTNVTHRFSFYRIPSASVDPERRNKWLAAINRKNWEPTAYTRLCSEHFVSGSKSDDPLAPDFVPSIFPTTPSPVKRRKYKDFDNYLRRKNSRNKRREFARRQAAAQGLIELQFTKYEEAPSFEEEYPGAFDPDVTLCSECVSKEAEIERLKMENNKLDVECRNLREENSKLQGTLKSIGMTHLKHFDGNDEKVKFLTGLQSFSVLITIFNLLKGHLNTSMNAALTEAQQLLLTLFRLRLNLNTQFLGYLFGIHQSTASRIFLLVVDVMYSRLVPSLIFWPSKEDICTSMPMCFQMTFPKCVPIIDCFELFCERSSDFKAKAQTYSSYKSHNTVKYLISVTPQGFISFLSKGWGGRTSDKHVVENSGYVNNLLQGDVILADRGFNIEATIALCGATLHIPAFTKGKPQLSGKEIEDTRFIASVRIHVERVIGLIRQKYTFLDATIPISMLNRKTDDLTSLDKVVHICAALSNTCTSLVPQS